MFNVANDFTRKNCEVNIAVQCTFNEVFIRIKHKTSLAGANTEIIEENLLRIRIGIIKLILVQFKRDMLILEKKS